MFPQRDSDILKFISGINPLTNNHFIWTTCGNGNIFYGTDTVSFYSSEKSIGKLQCLAHLSCQFENESTIKITYSYLANSKRQLKTFIPDHPDTLPFPDSLVTNPDSFKMQVETISKPETLLLNIYKEHIVFYTLRFLSLVHERDSVSGTEYYLLKFKRDIF
jgi:hypothetical protein